MASNSASVKTRALDELMAGTSILIQFAALALKLPGWSSEVDIGSNELQREGHGATDAALLSIGENDAKADAPLPGAVSTANATLDVIDALAGADHGQSSDQPGQTSWGSLPETERYYGAVDFEPQVDSDIIIPDDYDDIDSLADLEPLSPQSWEFDEEEMEAEQLWHTLDDPVVLTGLPEIAVSPPQEDIFPPLEDIEAYGLELEGHF